MINKIVPQYLNKSDDERLVKAVEMTNAENIRVSSDDDGDAGVLKTIKGNEVVRAKSGTDELPLEVGVYTIVGEISIPKKQQIIYFVRADDGANNGGQDSIYRYNVETNDYELLFKSNLLNFQRAKFVEADVVFNDKDETIIYFTDGENPPRKINVDRAVTDRDKLWRDSSDSDYYTDDERKEFLEVCKSAPLKPITFTYSTDTDFKYNNLVDKSFQFAYQYVYQDGEVSAISTYSKLAINPNTYGEGVVNTGFQTLNNKMTLTFTSGDSEVKKIRILARQGGSIVFYRLGEVDNPSASTGTFDFLNDASYPAVSNTEVDKLFDNVPLKANAQSISGNRLMYGDYIEGFDNISIDVDSSVVYEDVVDPGNISATLENPASGGPVNIIIDGTSMEDSYSRGAVIQLRVTLTGASTGKIRIRKNSGASTYLFSENVSNSSDSITIGVGKFNDSNSYIDVPLKSRTKVLTGTVVVSAASMSKSDVLDELASQIDGNTSMDYTETNNGVEYNSKGEIISVVSGSTYTAGESGEFGLDFTKIVIDFDEDTSYSVTDKRKIDLDISQLKVKVHYNTTTNQQLVKANGAPFTDTSTTSESSIVVANIYYVSKTGITLPNNVTYAFEAGVSSFKTSALHNFGIVYYDDKGRSSFVQKIDGVYVGGYADTNRSTKKGRVKVKLKIKHNPPSWASKYQIVYGGNETYDSFLQYTVAGAHRLTADSSGEAQNSIYLDLSPLEGKKISYSNDRGVDLEYTHNEGDILRIISYYDSSETRQYIDGFEFAVLRKEVVTTETDVSPNRASTYIVIRDEDYGSKDLDKWNLEKIQDGSDLWGQRVMVEILSPKKTNNETVYYEIGEQYDITSGAHVGDTTEGGYPVVQLEDGDVYFKPREILFAPFDSTNNEYDEDDYDDFEYDVLFVESMGYSDFFDSDYTSRGRAHAVLESAREVRRRSSITYSDPYVIDGDTLSLSSFNTATANFFDYDIRHGKIDRLIDQTDRLYIFQEHKVGFAPINRDILQTLTNANVVVSNNVLGAASYYAGSFGSSGYPAAVVERFGIMFFVDVKSQKVLRISRDGISPISDRNMDSYFDDKFSTYLTESNKEELDVIAGFDPDNNEYVLTSHDRGSYDGFTIGYDIQKKVWVSFYSFMPDMYSHINDKFFSFNGSGTNGNKQEVLWEHDINGTYGKFYNTQYNAKFSVVANANPSAVKSYDTISIEGTNAWSATLKTSDQQTTLVVADYDEREREFVASIPRDTLASTSNYITVGTVDSVDSANTGVTFKNRINTQPLPIGADLYYDNSGTLTSLSATLSSVDSSKKLTASANVSTLSEDDVVVLKLTAKQEGDQLRDYYCTIDFESSHSSSKVEAYAVNMHYNNERLHSELGQRTVAKK